MRNELYFPKSEPQKFQYDLINLILQKVIVNLLLYQIHNKNIDKTHRLMNKQLNRSRLFCMDDSPVKPANYIFDNTYRNMSEKKKFEKDPKFAYFNAIVKLKQNYMKNKRDVYEHMFRNPEHGQDITDSFFNIDDDSMYEIQRQAIRKQSGPRKVFHIQKINNHAFKIYKQKKNNVIPSTSMTADIQSLNNINFKLHFRGRAKHEQRETPKIQTLMKEYKKVQLMKSRVNPQTVVEPRRIQTSSLRSSKNGIQLKQKKRMHQKNSQNEILSILNQQNHRRVKSRSNMSELALRFS